MRHEAGNDRRLYMLSFDHRSSFARDLLGIAGEPAGVERAQISELKALIYAGFRQVIDEGAATQACSLLVDEEFGAEIARSASAAGYILAMPVERSGREEFELEFGDDFGEHIDAFKPAFSKVLVRYNPDGDAQLNARQAARLTRLSRWLRERDRNLLFELLVPATEAQLDEAGGDRDIYDRELRPALVVRTLAELQDAGVEPSIWKIEGLDNRADCESAVAQARKDGRDEVACIVLGRGADPGRVADWLRIAAPVRGYIGFAIGRTIWEAALREHLAGRLDADAATERIAAAYRRMIDTYTAAAANPT
jgi:myo-inositol catabolism protein IolC